MGAGEINALVERIRAFNTMLESQVRLGRIDEANSTLIELREEIALAIEQARVG